MKRGLLVLAAWLWGAAAQGASWSELWSRPDQRAQALLDAGQAAAAAPLFDDPRRRAYAEIKAQQYAEAAKQLQPLQDPESLYNRGNALTKSADLKAGLQAYEAALKQAPRDSALYRDALHNRDLVAKQLRSQPQAGGQQGKGQDKNQGQSQDQDEGQDKRGDHAQAQQQPGGEQSTQDQASKDNASQGQASQGQASQGQAAQGQRQVQAQSAPKDAAGANSANKPAGQDSRAGQDSAAAAQADARAAMQSAQDQGRTQNQTQALARAAQDGQTPDAKQKAAAAADAKPESEQALALEQWLRWIPDDPAGLLRRKFIIEHMMKQREAQP